MISMKNQPPGGSAVSSCDSLRSADLQDCPCSQETAVIQPPLGPPASLATLWEADPPTTSDGKQPFAPKVADDAILVQGPMLNFFELLHKLALAHQQEVRRLQLELERVQSLSPMAETGSSGELPGQAKDDDARRDYDRAGGLHCDNVKQSATRKSTNHPHPDTDRPVKIPSLTRRAVSMQLSNMLGEETDATRNFFNGPFDICVGFLVVVNAIILFCEYEYEGYTVAVHLGIEHDGNQWVHAKEFFNVMAHLFSAIFLLELLVRFALLRFHLFYDASHGGIQYVAVFDTLIVLLTSIDMYILQHLKSYNGGIFRLVRLARATRALRVVRVMHLFAKLRILVRTLAMSFMSLLWAMIMLVTFMFIAAVLSCRLVNPFILDEAVSLDIRLWLFENYGTSARALYTMFEVTFSGCWPNYARPLVVSISAWFAIFWFLYIVIVVFAVTRVITALFLQDTMKASQYDAETMVQNRIMQRGKYLHFLEELFVAADTSGDGYLSLEELEVLLVNPKVKVWFQVLDLEVHEVCSLYHLLEDDGDGLVSRSEFLQGVMRLKGQSRALDVVAIGRDCQNIMAKQRAMENSLQRIEASCSRLWIVSK